MTYAPYILLVILALDAAPAAGQATGDCADAQAEAYLDVNNVRARIFNNGPLFWRGSPNVYEVPRGDSTNALFTSGIWIGGLVRDTIRTAAARYGWWEFWPGPLDDQGNPPADCTRYDQIYEITRDDLIAYAETGTPTENLLTWPWHLGAPVLDGDGDPDNYHLDGGDRPALIGDQMLWWVMNDAGGEHRTTRSRPIGMEVHGSAFAFSRPHSPFDTITFYRYKLLYKGQEPLEHTYFGIFTDPDLGNFSDDYLGSDTLLHLGFVYNSDNDDVGRWGSYGYEGIPPAAGYTFLHSAVADADGRDNDRDGAIDEPGEELGLTSFMYYNSGGGVTEDPQTARDYYYYMQALWRDGRPVTYGGNGRDFTDIPTRFFWPGDPTTGAYWSEMNSDGRGTPIAASDRRGALATGPFTMQPGDEQEVVFAIVWARGSDHLDSVRRLKTTTAKLHRVANALLVPDVTSGISTPAPAPAPVLGFAQNYPNPFREATTIRYSVPQPMHVRLRVYDVLGREIATLVDERRQPGIYTVPFETSGLSPGVYVYRIEMDHFVFTKRMTLVR